MKRGTVSCSLFAIACVAAAALSAQILGPGMWGAIFLGAGVIVAISPYFPAMRGPGRVVAVFAGVLAFLAAALGLLAATIGGSFRLPADQAFLLLAFGFIGVFGIAAFRRLATDNDAF